MTTTAYESALQGIQAKMGELSTLLVQQGVEIKQFGETKGETSKAIATVEKSLEELAQEAQEHRQKFNEEMEEAKNRLDEFEKKLVRPNQGPGKIKTLSQSFLESDTYSEFMKRNANNSNNFEIKGTFFGATGSEEPAFFRRALGQFDSNGDPLGGSLQLLEVYANPMLPRTVRELIPSGVTGLSQVEYPYETVRMPLRSRLAAEAAAAQKVLTVEYTAGWKEGAELKIGNEKHTVASIDTDAKTITVENNLAETYPAGTDVYGEYFVPTKEGNRKPESGLTIEMRKQSVETVASWIPVTRQMMSDAPMVRTYVEGRLPEQVLQSSERQILYGDGTDSRELQGLLTNTDIQTYKWSQGKVGDNKYDAIRRAITLAVLAGYPVDAVVLHSLDWEDIETLKGDDNHYLRIQLYDNMGRPMVWRVKVVESFHLKQGHFLLGAFSMGARLWLNEQLILRISDSHADNFVKNTLVLLAEERLALTTMRPQSFVAGEFDEEPSEP